jgi:hypothetical protein
MKHPVVEALQTQRLIADIRRVVAILNSDIAAEEEQARVADPRLPEYPLLARTLATRRDNLEATLASLEKRVREPAWSMKMLARLSARRQSIGRYRKLLQTSRNH